jgi:hypothetical protein
MSNTKHRASGEPQPERGPTKRARGLDPEFTAQPRPIADQMALDASAEPGLPVDPEDLGARFLTDAIEQGDFDPGRSAPRDVSLFESPAGDEPLLEPNFAPTNSIWEQTVDVSVRTANDAQQLRGPTLLSEEDEDGEGPHVSEATQPLHLTQSSIRELSLFDREGDEANETVAPEVDVEEGGRHVPATARELGAPVVAAATRLEHRTFERHSQRARGSLAKLLIKIADAMRGWAERLQPAEPQSQPRKRAPAKIDEPSIPNLPIG